MNSFADTVDTAWVGSCAAQDDRTPGQVAATALDEWTAAKVADCATAVDDAALRLGLRLTTAQAGVITLAALTALQQDADTDADETGTRAA